MVNKLSCYYRLKYFIISLLIFLLCGKASGQNQYNIPYSPCPDIFQYSLDENGWHGEIKYSNPKRYNQIHIATRLLLNRRVNHYGSLNILKSNKQTLNDLAAGRPILYRVNFPFSNPPLPEVQEITANGETLCVGNPNRILPFTNIYLQYTYQSIFSYKSISGPSDEYPGIFYPDPLKDFPDMETDLPIDVRIDPQTRPSSWSVIKVDQIPSRPSLPSFPPTQSLPPSQSIPQPQPLPPSQSFPQPQPLPPSQSFPPPQPLPPSTSPPLPSRPPVQIPSPVLNEQVCGQISELKIKQLVIGGDIIEKGSWPWLAAIFVRKSYSLDFKCGGSLLSEKFVITSAHCFQTQGKLYNAEDVMVALGMYKLFNWSERGSKTMESDAIYIHPDYSKNYQNFDADVALVSLKETIGFSDTIKPICLWTGSSDLNNIVGVDGVVVGWGKDENGRKYTPEPKRVTTTIVSESTCVRKNTHFTEITSNRTLCAGKLNGQGPCSGDSGTGLMLYMNNRWILRGTVSAAISDESGMTCNLNEYIVYADIAKFTQWIQTYI